MSRLELMHAFITIWIIVVWILIHLLVSVVGEIGINAFGVNIPFTTTLLIMNTKFHDFKIIFCKFFLLCPRRWLCGRDRSSRDQLGISQCSSVEFVATKQYIEQIFSGILDCTQGSGLTFAQFVTRHLMRRKK